MSQRVPQLPQLVGSTRTSVQKPWHDTWGAGHWLTQAPARQASLGAQTMLQPPQLKRSDSASTQLVPHCSRPAAHWATQLAAWHSWPLGQTLPHAPQFWASESRLEQVPLHSFKGALQVQLPCTQLCSAVQVPVQLPQCWESRCKSTQAPPQLVRPPPHEPWQAPFWQTRPVAQTLPQAPQFRGSLLTAMQTPPQRTVPLVHTVVVSISHRLAMQSMPSGQGASPGVPQKSKLVREQLVHAVDARAMNPSVRSSEVFVITLPSTFWPWCFENRGECMWICPIYERFRQ